MNKTLRIAGHTVALLLAASAHALESTWIYAVQLNATAQSSPPRIELSWVVDPLPVTHYVVHRKAPADKTWGEGITLPGSATSFVDENVTPGAVYEYQVMKRGATYNFTGYGYISAGLEAPLAERRGKVLLVVDRSVAAPLASELERWQLDLAGDGWTVVRRDIERDDSPVQVKARIQAEYQADPEQLKAVLLFGRVPVVRSGNLNVDGHLARPMPADAFYGDMDGEWTDANGDGIYDQSLLPSDVELQVGRVDFADLPGTYAATPYPGEVELLRRYLEKNHAYRHGKIRPAHRALIGGLGDANGQAYTAGGFRNFAALVGSGNISVAEAELTTPANERWIGRLTQQDYLWAFGSGGGGDFSVSGLGTHPAYNDLWSMDFIDLKPRGTFYLLFGSWFGDWSKSENLLRSALTAPEYGLASAWSGRPHLFFHAMGVGETIGQGIRVSQNNDGRLYQNQVQRQLRGVHVALMGDPTLRMHIIAPPIDAHATAAGEDVSLTWQPSPDPILGYHVYRGTSPQGPFARLTDSPVSGTRFVDPSRANEPATYLIRAVKLETSPSGTYYNASQGAFARLGSGTSRATETVWVDDVLPAGAIPFADNDRWNWIGANPAPVSGGLAHQADAAAGLHHHFFAFATTPLQIDAGDVLFAHVYIDPQNPPRSLMLTWCSDTWEHRAYWGENNFTEGVDGGFGRKRIGDMPAAGGWVRLEIPASAVGLEGHAVTGMGFTLVDGRVTWDRAGKRSP